jgi:S-(hydroxymethyl)glutathione dehydrogenase/alcohol dehydrogenase
MKAVVLREVGQHAVVEQLTLRPVGRHEVNVQLAASGVCHTDLSVRRSCPGCLRGDSHLCPSGLQHAFGGPYASSADGGV